MVQKRARHDIYAKLIFSDLFKIKSIAIPNTRLTGPMSRSFPDNVVRKKNLIFYVYYTFNAK